MSTFGERLVEEYFERVQRYVRMRVPAQDYEDVVAEIFLRAIQRQAQLRGNEAAWLFALARSRVSDYHRERAAMRIESHPLEAAAPAAVETASPEPLAKLETAEFRARLQRQMKYLSEQEREAVALKFTEGLTNAQIAAALGVTPGNLGVILHRALARLRQAMLGEGA